MHAWATAFLERLGDARPAHRFIVAEQTLMMQITEIRQGQRLTLLLDYDGTLVPLARAPELAVPDAELMLLLERLATTEGLTVEIVSGRPRETLEHWFGGLPLALSTDHGFWYRQSPAHAWQAAAEVPFDWLRKIAPTLQQFTESTPGSQIETKSASVAWHYRRADHEFGARQAHELRMLLGDTLSNQPFEVVEGKKVIEVRLRGVSKGLVAQRLGADEGRQAIMAIGDDRTDEDLFRALPSSSITIAVGSQPLAAKFRVDDFRAVRHLLQILLGTADPETLMPEAV